MIRLVLALGFVLGVLMCAPGTVLIMEMLTDGSPDSTLAMHFVLVTTLFGAGSLLCFVCAGVWAVLTHRRD